MKISWVILTWNRKEVVEDCILQNTTSRGTQVKEVIWIDNGSTDGMQEALPIYYDIKVSNRENLGVARGYNSGMLLARGSHILITGCDRKFPDLWLSKMVEAFEKIPNLACVSIYSQNQENYQDRYLSETQTINGISFKKSLPFEARLFRRDLLEDVGYFHEGFGLYSWDDCHWGPRFMKVCDQKGLLYISIDGLMGTHVGRIKDEPDYKDFKKKETDDPKKIALLNKLANDGFPKFNMHEQENI